MGKATTLPGKEGEKKRKHGHGGEGKKGCVLLSEGAKGKKGGGGKLVLSCQKEKSEKGHGKKEAGIPSSPAGGEKKKRQRPRKGKKKKGGKGDRFKEKCHIRRDALERGEKKYAAEGKKRREQSRHEKMEPQGRGGQGRKRKRDWTRPPEKMRV